MMIVPLKEPRAIESIAPTTAEVITPAKITEACLRDASFCRERGTGSLFDAFIEPLPGQLDCKPRGEGRP